MKLKRLGFFSDLPYGDSSEKQVAASVFTIPSNEKGKVVAYLKAGRSLIVSPGFSRDVFMTEIIIGPLAILTDGVYVWPSDLAYYVEKHDVGLPDYFLEHARTQGWSVSDVDVRNLEM